MTHRIKKKKKNIITNSRYKLVNSTIYAFLQTIGNLLKLKKKKLTKN